MDARFSSAIHTLNQAVNDTEPVHLFDLHQNPSDQCIVGRHIKPVLTGMFAETEDAFASALARKTLADCATEQNN